MFHNLAQLLRYRGLIQSLVARELKARYRGSVLGFFWSFINPLLLLLVYSFVFNVVMKDAHDARIEPYALFMFCGILPWTWFSTSLAESSGVLISGGNLIKKVLFPAEVLPIVTVLANMVHFFLGLPILAGFLLYSLPAGRLHPGELALFPLVVLVQLVLTIGFALILSALTVHFRDIRDILSNLLTFWFFATPIIYPYFIFEPVKPSVVVVDRADVTIGAPVALPGVVLPAGTYRFALADPQAYRTTVQVFDTDGTRVVATAIAMPAQRPQVTGESIVPFREAPAGSPPAARYWYYAGQTNGLEFAYPGAQAKTIASAAKEPVLALDTDSPNPQDMKSAGFTRVTQEGTAEPLPPETVMWQATALKLNPFTHLAITYQEILFFAGPVGHLKWLLVLGAISVVFFLFGYWVFDRLRDTFAEEV